ncbi:ribose 1,5-bisphosphokinase [Musicola paradisiaca]|uniref:Ribose 1,5-bisphosphate phosphokinase PhnN n=1 Tax=Musicola paradisiaca (strain Ech703) TaxID=579405 RepID=C6CDK0_MUSP7|nr:ribose 1,5-bisphosphokinase [Musicola paradisiaca]ACS85117.1 phosphonate metabolism protein/1,5-bisphosphokinase (PRPP-forming) PhnN [Musicola paradisiaca Ech703]
MARLIWLTGASGAGKDALLEALRRTNPTRLLVAHRYITRSASAGGENHVALSEAEFAYRRERGLFALHWQAHQYHYGIGIEVDAWLSAGLDVVVNGSRACLVLARQRYGRRLLPVGLQVSPDVLAQRLSARGRETAGEIAQRMQRTVPTDDDAVAWIDNDGPLAQTLHRFYQLLEENEWN